MALLQEDAEVFTDKYGVTMFLDPVQKRDELLKTRRFYDDEGVLRLCERILQPGMTVVDVGANLGQFALFCATRVGQRGSVHAFEPASQSYELLKRNVELNRHQILPIVAQRIAISDRAGAVEFHEFAREYSVWNSLHAHDMKVFAGGVLRTVRPSHIEQVQATTLDDYCAAHGIKEIDLLKIDVEGWEVSAMRGARTIFEQHRCRNLIFEISLEPLRGTPWTAADVLRTASDMGFSIGRIAEDGEVEPISLDTFVAPPFANYFGQLI